ncbi:hypothetical protein DB347_21985 [Opitutaceae bacterium EW11]|nr:hypothetical protein DB347_21985 [Opitutaceae bacterium EW11]
MNSLRGCSICAGVLALALQAAFAVAPQSAPDQKISVVRKTDPVIRPSIGEKLPAGQATVLIQVDGAGQLMDTLVVSYTHPYYAEAIVNALKQWEYKPALKGGEPVVARARLVFQFDVKQQVLTFTRSDLAEALWANAAGAPRDLRCVYTGKELDELPKPITVVQPLRIAPPDQAVPAGRVLIDFFIDETGKPRMPAAVRYDDERMAGSALQAIAQWRFTPPMRQGKPVTVQAQQWFEFSADK